MNIVTRYIGIDPGERWTGFALFEIDQDKPGRYRAEIGVMDVKNDLYRPVKILLHYCRIHSPEDIIIVAEDYQVRPQGHNSFNRALVARLLGALEYEASKEVRTSWNFVTPGNPDKQLALLGLSNLFESWGKSFKRPKANHWKRSEWDHGRSAWRCLAQMLLTDEPEILQSIRFVKASKSLPLVHGCIEDVDAWSVCTLAGGLV